jgi:CrcB protein
MILLAIALGGAVGALARYQVGVLLPPSPGGVPWSTLLINITGSFLLAFIYRYVDGMSSAPEIRALLGVGFCGAFTTFSAFSFEAVRLLQDGHATRAALYVTASVALCMVGTAAGLWLGAGRAS